MAINPELKKNILEELRAQQTTSLRDTIEQVYGDLVVNAGIASLPETLFVQHFLPYFCGELKITAAGAPFVNWIAIAGSPTAFVNIIDTEGRVVLKIPPLFDTDVVNLDSSHVTPAVGDLLQMYELSAQTLPVRGIRYLEEHLPDKIDSLSKPSRRLTENEQLWSAVFERYKKPNPYKPVLASKTTDVFEDSDFIYDD